MPKDRIDWEQVIIQIQRSTWLKSSSDRMSLLAIGEACGRSFGWAWNLKNIPGTEPRYSDGVLLLRLWSEKTGGSEPPVHQEPEHN